MLRTGASFLRRRAPRIEAQQTPRCAAADALRPRRSHDAFAADARRVLGDRSGPNWLGCATAHVCSSQDRRERDEDAPCDALSHSRPAPSAWLVARPAGPRASSSALALRSLHRACAPQRTQLRWLSVSPSDGPPPKRDVAYFKALAVENWKHFKDTMKLYWLGTKLLWADTKTAWGILKQVLRGSTLTRRERKQLLRTTADIFRVVPFAVFIIVPFMEFLLPVALALFPGMLPSTFQDSTKVEEKAKALLGARLKLASFLGDTLDELERPGKKATDNSELEAFIAKSKAGNIDNDDVIRFARYFGDELTLDNLTRLQLVHLCNYMGLRTFGGDNLLRFQLRSTVRELRADDQRILFEGVSNLSRHEMQEACADRGMKGVGLTKLAYRRQLEGWLELSANRQVPISLLIMSRAFTLEKYTEGEDEVAAIGKSISALDAAIVNEAVVEAGGAARQSTLELKARKLESIAQQNRLIVEERRHFERGEAKDKIEAANLKEMEALQKAESFDEVWERPPDGEAAALSADEVLKKKKKKEAAEDDEAHEVDEKLMVAELLADMAYESALKHERQEIDLLKTRLVELKSIEAAEPAFTVDLAPDAQASSSASEDDAAKALATAEAVLAKIEKPDGKLTALKKKLARMVQGLEQEMESVDTSLGAKLHFLDRDNDGVISADEVRVALTAIWKAKGRDPDRAKLDDFVAEILSEIDADDDGVVTVAELEDWLRGLEERREDM
ncbi:LETM1-like protein-domain-containing protein [Pelagophyceae sp. CCMP2097]|nr:LETM1-like protein-domain-containing protein [Pelagophyceae sp. CCMP2097]